MKRLFLLLTLLPFCLQSFSQIAPGDGEGSIWPKKPTQLIQARTSGDGTCGLLQIYSSRIEFMAVVTTSVPQYVINLSHNISLDLIASLDVYTDHSRTDLIATLNSEHEISPDGLTLLLDRASNSCLDCNTHQNYYTSEISNYFDLSNHPILESMTCSELEQLFGVVTLQLVSVPTWGTNKPVVMEPVHYSSCTSNPIWTSACYENLEGRETNLVCFECVDDQSDLIFQEDEVLRDKLGPEGSQMVQRLRNSFGNNWIAYDINGRKIGEISHEDLMARSFVFDYRGLIILYKISDNKIQSRFHFIY